MSETTLTPPRLHAGDVVRLVSPSAASASFFSHRVSAARRALESLGLVVRHEAPPAASVRFDCASRAWRLAELHAAFADREVKMVLCNIGGIAANDLLRHLDYALIAANPKVFCGYSDNTLLHHAIYAKTGLRTFYGPMAMTSFGEHPEPMSPTMEHFRRVLFSAEVPGALVEPLCWTDECLDWSVQRDLTRPRKMRTDAKPSWVKPGRASGRLYGGCLPSMLQLLGTPYSVDYRGRILFLETPESDDVSTGLPLSTVRSQLRDLENAGVFEQIAGLVVGRPYGYSAAEIRDFENIVEEQLCDYAFPALINVSIGHTDPLFTVPMDGIATLDADTQSFCLEEPCVT